MGDGVMRPERICWWCWVVDYVGMTGQARYKKRHSALDLAVSWQQRTSVHGLMPTFCLLHTAATQSTQASEKEKSANCSL